MAVIALGVGFDVKCRFTNRQIAIVTATTVTEHLLVIDIAQQMKTKGGVTGLTQVSGRRMGAKLWQYRINRTGACSKAAVMAFRTL